MTGPTQNTETVKHMSTVSDKPKTDKATEVVLQNVRLSYPSLFRARKANEEDTGEPKFSASFLLDKTVNAKDIAAIQKVVNALLAEKFKGKKLPPDKICLRDGSLKPDVEGYHDDMMYVSASNARKPQVVDSNRAGRSPISADDSRIFAGIYVNAVIRLWAMDNKFGKRINASLEAVQYVRPGDALGAAPVNTDDAFGGIPDAEDDDVV